MMFLEAVLKLGARNPNPRFWRWVVLMLAVCAMLSWSCQRRGQGPNLLSQQAPHKTQGVLRTEVLTDEIIANPGDPWKTNLTAIFQNSEAFVEYDLGRVEHIGAAVLQTDNDDEYTLSVSEDGKSFAPLWSSVSEQHGAGMQLRFNANLQGNARYLRISGARGDGAYSVSEVQVFSAAPAQFPPNLSAKQGAAPGQNVLDKTMLLGFALVCTAFIVSEKLALHWVLLAWLLPAFAGWQWFEAVRINFPPEPRHVALLRAAMAATAFCVVVREVFFSKLRPPRRFTTLGILGICALLSSAAFYNLGHGQFWDHAGNRPVFAHQQDLRMHFPIAKYFKELRYTRLNWAAAEAFIEETQTPAEQVSLRDPRQRSAVRASEAAAERQETKNHFTPERWQAFKADMRFFWETMGHTAYLDALQAGAPSTSPFWFLISHFLFSGAASFGLFNFAAWLDPVFLGLAFLAIGKSFGPRSALIAMIIFGTSDFSQFGNNWAGSSLRHDWLFLLAFSACLLKRAQVKAAGALLGVATLLRGYPILAVFGAVLPMVWWCVDKHPEANWSTRLKLLFSEQAWLKRFLAGFGIALGAGFALSLLLADIGDWGYYLRHSELWGVDPGPNDIGLRGLIGGWEADHLRTLRSRAPVYWVLMAVYTSLVVVGARRMRPERSSMLALSLIPIFFFPPNYIIQFIFLWTLLTRERELIKPLKLRDASIWLITLALCAMSYFTILEDQIALHFHYETMLFFAALSSILFLVTQRNLGRLVRELSDPALESQ